MSYLITDAEHKINTECFSLSHLHSIFINRGYDSKTGELLDFVDAKKYILKFFYRIESGYIFNENGKIESKTDELVTKAYIRRFEAKIKQWFVNSPEITIYKTVCIPNRQLVQGNTINIMSKFKYDADIKYSDCSKKEKEGVNMMLKFISEVWCSNNNEQYEYILNWIANMIQGNKNQTLLYVKSSTEGIGKSTLTNFIMKHVIGHALSIQSNSYPLLTGNNVSLLGKLLVVFEELSKSTKNEWEKMSSCLKEWITSDIIQYTEKYVAPFTSSNVNNYIINTNTESIKSADGRRYYICDLSTKYLNNEEYWDTINNTCFNDNVGKAFYIYMVERDVKKFNSAVFPLTTRKKEYIVDLIKSPFKFLKFNYVLTNKNITSTVKELYEYYVNYCQKIEQKEYSKRSFTSLLSEIGINYKSSNSKQLYNIDNKLLKSIAEQHRWYSSDDTEEMEDNVIWKDYIKVKDIATPINNLFLVKDYEDELEKLRQQILVLQNKNEELQQEVKLLKQPKEPEEPEEPVKKLKKVKNIKKESVKKVKKIKKESKVKSYSPCDLFLGLITDEE